MGLTPGPNPAQLENSPVGEVVLKKTIKLSVEKGKLSLENTTAKVSYLIESLLKFLISEGVQFPFRRDQCRPGVYREQMNQREGGAVDTGQPLWFHVMGRLGNGTDVSWDLADAQELQSHLKGYANGATDIRTNSEINSIPHTTMVMRQEVAKKVSPEYLETSDGKALIKGMARTLLGYSISHNSPDLQTQFLSSKNFSVQEE